MLVHGDRTGLKKSHITNLERLYDFTVPYGQAATEELLYHLVSISAEIKREVAIYINRRGHITHVSVGNQHTVTLPEAHGRRSQNRLCGLRCIHTHPDGDCHLSSVDLASLKEMRFDFMAAIGMAGNAITTISVGFINGTEEGDYQVQTLPPLEPVEFVNLDIVRLIAEIEQILQVDKIASGTTTIERAFLVGVERSGGWDVRESLSELAQLAETAGADVVGMTWQKREKPDAALYIGKGKVEEISLLRQANRASLVIFDEELTTAQNRNLEQAWGCKVVDRTALILDIFAQRARTFEGKLQVELAQLRYNLPRLGGQGLVLSRLGGGIGTRGPGETKLEVDRRRIRSRISDIEQDIENLRSQREIQRRRRQTSQIPTVSLVGYTNAGKSTLLNSLTAANVLAEDKLFATLDPTTRRIELPGIKEVLITDTVGFIQKIPHQLVAAFRATLEEVLNADLLLHIVDASHSHYSEQMAAVYEVLRQLKADTKPVITVYNKIDRITNEHFVDKLLREPSAITVSAITGQGLPKLLEMMEQLLKRTKVRMEIAIPYQDAGLVAQLYFDCDVLSVDYEDAAIQASILVSPDKAGRYKKYQIRSEDVDQD